MTLLSKKKKWGGTREEGWTTMKATGGDTKGAGVNIKPRDAEA